MLSSSSSSGVDDNLARKRQIDDLPQEILQDILSRVSAKYVLRCRSVCRLWKALTSTLYFGELHHHNRNPNRNFTVLVEELSRPADDDGDFTVVVEEMPRPVDDDGDYYLVEEMPWPVDDDGEYDSDYPIDNLYKSEKKMYIFDAWRGGGVKKVINNPHPDYYNAYDDHKDGDDDDEEKRFIISPSPDYSYIDAYDEEDPSASTMYISGSSCGLVVLHHKHLDNLPFSSNFVIMNPIFPDNKVKIRVTEELKILAQIFGVFFHPVLKEFCALWGQTPQERNSSPCENNVVKGYKLLNLGPTPSPSRWRNINNQSTGHILKKHLQPRIRGHNGGTVGVTSPVVLDDVLYWMVDEQTRLIWPNPECCEEAILGFDTKTEEFQLLPHPGLCACHQNKYAHQFIDHQESMHLLENTNNRHLSLCQFSNIDAEWLFSIWIFKKDEEDEEEIINTSINKNGSWIKTHTVKHNDHDIIGSYDHQLCFPPISSRAFRPIGMVDEELLLVQVWTLGYLFVCNLKLGTCQRFESKRGTDNNTLIPVGGVAGTFMCAHIHTFLPIRTSNPEILLEEE